MMDDDGETGAEIRRLHRDLDVATRRQTSNRGELWWRIARLEQRRGDLEEFARCAVCAAVDFLATSKSVDAAMALLAVHSIPTEKLSTFLRMRFYLSSYIYACSYDLGGGTVASARADVLRTMEEIGLSKPDWVGYMKGYLQWYSMNEMVAATFLTSADIAPKAAQAYDYTLSREALWAHCVDAGLDNDMGSAQAAAKKLASRAVRIQMSDNDKQSLTVCDARLSYFASPTAANRKRVLAVLARDPQRLAFMVEIEFLAFDGSLTEREARFRSSLRRVKRPRSVYTRLRCRRLIAVCATNRVRLALGLAPKTFRPDLRETNAGITESVPGSRLSQWRAEADRAVRALERWSRRLDGIHDCSNFSARAQEIRAELQQLASETHSPGASPT